MEIKIKIDKKHVFFLTFLIIGFAGVIFVIAQPATPNPGHSIAEVPGATPNCLSSPTALAVAE